MKKTLLGIIFLLIAKLCLAEGYETKTVFVLDVYPGPNELGRILSDCVRGTEEEDDTEKIKAMIEASLIVYKAELDYQATPINTKKPTPTDAKKIMKRAEAQLREVELLTEAIEEDAVCRRRISYYFDNLARDVISDINSVTNQGWEIKSSRRAWMDLWANQEIEDFEWGTEYVLQRPMKKEKVKR